MASSTTELIKGKIDIVDFLRGYLALQQAGKNFKANCPFHKEKTPSFMVSPDRQSWHCFGCSLGGDIFSFLMRYENIEFGEALRILGERAGVELKKLNPTEYKYTGLLQDLNTIAKEFYKRALKNNIAAKKYLASRGLKEETIETFELGWAPAEREALTMHFLNTGFRPEDVLQAGLALKTERGLLMDRFRGRIMFPIHNHFGKVVGFTGRILPEFDNGETGKYVNSPETPIFNKSKLLYGFWQTKNAIREENAVFVVEGQMDMLMSWQAGVKNVVASSGTAFTADHLRVLRRLTDRMILSFDSDSAGREAGERAIDLAEAADFNVKVVSFEEFKDPAEAVEAGPEKLLEAIRTARPAPEFYFEKYLGKERFNVGDREQLKNLRMVLVKLKAMASAIERDAWMKELAKRVGVDEKLLMEEAEKLEGRTVEVQKFTEEGATEKRTITRRERIGEELLGAALAKNDFDILGESRAHLIPAQQDLLEVLQRGEKKSSDPRVDERINFIMLRSQDLPAEEIAELRRQLTAEYVKERRQLLTNQIRTAEAKGDEHTVAAALAALEELRSLAVLPTEV